MKMTIVMNVTTQGTMMDRMDLSVKARTIIVEKELETMIITTVSLTDVCLLQAILEMCVSPQLIHKVIMVSRNLRGRMECIGQLV